MRSPADWLADQVAARPDDFLPDEMAAPLAWIASVQADARADLVALCDEARRTLLTILHIHKFMPEGKAGIEDLAARLRAETERANRRAP